MSTAVLSTAQLPRHRAPIVVDRSTWRGRALVPVLVYVGLLVAVISSLGSPLIPTIATDYGVSLGAAQWSLTITLLVGAVSSPVIGRLGDGPRRQHVLLMSLAVLVTGSVLAALPAKVFVVLLAGRAMQGIGLALLPLAMSVARDHLDPDRARSTLATLSVTAVVGVGLGYPLTGLISEHLNFHAGFWMAAGLGVIAMVLSALVVPTSMHRPSQRFDLAGAGMLGLGLAGLLVAISQGGDWGWTSASLLGVAGASVLLLIVWVWHELRTDDALVDLRLMQQRTVLTANTTAVLAGVGMYMLMSMVIRYVETPTATGYGLDASVVVAGLVLLPLSAASFLASKFVVRVSDRITPERLLPVGLLAFVLAMVIFATSRSHLWEIFLVMAVGGVGIGCSFAVMPRMIVSVVPASHTSSALALNQVLRTVGYSIGSALAATVLTAHTEIGNEFPDDRGYTVGALIAIVLCLLSVVTSVVLPDRSARRAAATDGSLDGDIELQIEESVDAGIAGAIAFETDEFETEEFETEEFESEEFETDEFETQKFEEGTPRLEEQRLR
ncbi:predicted MFS family arabinose efflux permease [Jatrophihabitans sp. GAS493]|uniref:MFS transporter n=1 Tax=Jatrophihabitans sp. GAS493 TaxID=1907575 RepID=UPI000BBFC27F|nr:MFS transporter [Jatrophihabitans sp. GAS493]SOD73349.1 predicted MFS family arabinose efflux permease [Jatrophihabitans sp. GAS493]